MESTVLWSGAPEHFPHTFVIKFVHDAKHKLQKCLSCSTRSENVVPQEVQICPVELTDTEAGTRMMAMMAYNYANKANKALVDARFTRFNWHEKFFSNKTKKEGRWKLQHDRNVESIDSSSRPLFLFEPFFLGCKKLERGKGIQLRLFEVRHIHAQEPLWLFKLQGKSM